MLVRPVPVEVWSLGDKLYVPWVCSATEIPADSSFLSQKLLPRVPSELSVRWW